MTTSNGTLYFFRDDELFAVSKDGAILLQRRIVIPGVQTSGFDQALMDRDGAVEQKYDEHLMIAAVSEEGWVDVNRPGMALVLDAQDCLYAVFQTGVYRAQRLGYLYAFGSYMLSRYGERQSTIPLAPVSIYFDQEMALVTPFNRPIIDRDGYIYVTRDLGFRPAQGSSCSTPCESKPGRSQRVSPEPAGQGVCCGGGTCRTWSSTTRRAC